MKDNAITTTDGIEVYKHNINYYADEYIRNELEMPQSNCRVFRQSNQFRFEE